MSTYSPPGTGGGYNPYENHPMMPSTGHGIPHEQRRPTPPGSEDGAELEEYVVRVRAQPVAPVDEDGQVTTHRALTANQVTMITLGGTFGTGLLVATGTSYYEGGPLGVLIAFTFVGFICYCVMTSLCEMATYLPHKKGFVGYVSRYVHPAVGFGLGWTYLCQFVFVPASHVNTAAIVMEYAAFSANPNDHNDPVGHYLPVPKGVWRLIFTVLIICINLFPIRAFGRIEFWLSSFKIVALISLILFGLIVDLGGARLKTGGYDRIGFRLWGHPYGPLGHQGMGPHATQLQGDTNRFLGWWATMVGTWFSYMGMELIGVVVGEAVNPRVSVPRAIKRTYRLVFTLYILGAIVMGLICNSNDKAFSSSDPKITHNGQTSPFIIAAYQLAAKGLIPVISAVIVIFALSGATSNIFTGSRLLYGLTLDKQAPQFLRKVSPGGRPIAALAVCAVWSFLSYAGISETTTNNQAFGYFTDLTSTAGAIAWICILWAHIRFRAALKAQYYPLDTLRYLSPVFPYGTYFALICTVVFTIFKGHESYVNRQAGGVIVAYLLVVLFLVLTLFWKWLHNEEATPLERINLTEGRREIDLEEEMYQIKKARQPPRPWYRRLMSEIE